MLTLSPRGGIEPLEILTEVDQIVTLSYLDLYALLAADEGGKARERLLSRAANTNKHGRAAWCC